MRAISTFFLAIIISQSALAGSYSVTLREFGFNRQNCRDDIAAVAEKFAADAHAVILSSGCLPAEIGEAFPSGKFTYAATSWIGVTTSDVREAWGLDGYYQSVDECESALQFERGIFIRLTALQPFVGYCYQANTLSTPRYRVRLDAVGISAVKKHSMSTSWAHRAVNESELVSDVQLMVTSLGGEIVAAAVDRDISRHLVAVDYYHESNFHLHSQELLYWRSAELCQASANSMKEQWNFGAAKSVFHCTATASGMSRMLQVYLSDNVLGGYFDTEVLATAYPSQSACVSDTLRIRSALEQSGTTVLGMTCGQENTLQSWRIAVFTR